MLEFYDYHYEKHNQIICEKPIHYDAIILDLNMPIMNGHEACKQILQIYKDYNERQIGLKGSEDQSEDGHSNADETYVNRRPIIVASSAHVTEEIQQQCLNEGFDMITGVPMEKDFL